MKNLDFLVDLLCAEFNPDAECASGISTPTATTMAAAQAIIAKEETDAIIAASKEQLIVDRYSQDYMAIKHRSDKKISAARLAELKAVTEENNLFAAGGKSIEDHKKKMQELADIREKEMRKASQERSAEIESLNKQCPTGESLCRRHGIYI